MILLVHPHGNQNVRQALAAFSQANLVHRFHTTVYWNSNWSINSWLPGAIRSELNRRSYPQVLRRDVTLTPMREAGRLLAIKFGLSSLVESDSAPLSATSVSESLDHSTARIVQRRRPKAVYAYEGGALQTFRAARRQGTVCIYEQPCGYWSYVVDLLREEANLRPEYADTMMQLWHGSDFLEKRDEELRLADHIIIPSHHVGRTLERAPVSKEKIHIVPYGADGAEGPARVLGNSHGRKLRVLWVGSLTQQKGIGYVLDAVKMLGSSIEFTMVGRKVGRSACIDAAVNEHRWIPSIPHNAVLAEMAQSDVFVMPSLSEGLALVILEALSRGLPVITTTSSGAEEIVRDGRDGFFVPIRSSKAIAEKLELLDRDRDLLDFMSASALERAPEFTWQRYRNLLVSTLSRMVA